MLQLTLRDEFRGRRLKGTAIELANANRTGATQMAAADFLEITYPSADALKALEATGSGQGRPLVLIGERGQGKSHLLGLLFHGFRAPDATRRWLEAWAGRLGAPELAALPLRDGMHVISESLHRQHYKLEEIARTLGKLDEQGSVAEDLRTQILGQLAERLTYDALYREALSDPELRRTRQELDAAMANASEARKVVFELFQDLDRFSLDDYRPFADVDAGFDRIVRFLGAALAEQGQSLRRLDGTTFALVSGDVTEEARFTTDREQARAQEDLELIGLDHPLLVAALRRWQRLEPEQLGAAVAGGVETGGAAGGNGAAVVSWWSIRIDGGDGERRSLVQPLAVAADGRRLPQLEREGAGLFRRPPGPPALAPAQRRALLRDALEPMIRRELDQRGLVTAAGGYTAKLVGWIELAGNGAAGQGPG